jgi:hypothetical protein
MNMPFHKEGGAARQVHHRRDAELIRPGGLELAPDEVGWPDRSGVGDPSQYERAREERSPIEI